MEGDPNKNKKIEVFADYGNEFVGAAGMLKNGESFADVLELLKKYPPKSTEEYLDSLKESSYNEQLLAEYNAHPAEMKRLNDIAEAMRNLGEHDEARFKDLVDEAWEILLGNRTFFD
ncbi:MAG TPA: hypothetical protein PK950_02525 [Candidatus Paceibacterota bacterium]|nr:hypothetical protein [Candidatus Paceibacterota bacterium]